MHPLPAPPRHQLFATSPTCAYNYRIMPGYRLLKHRQYDRSADRLPAAIQHKAVWSQVMLGTRGRTPEVKSTTGYNARWRRTPVQGYHYYLWWIPLSESNLADGSAPAGPEQGRTILVHSIRHHDETDDPIDLRSLDDFEEVQLSNLDPRYDEQRSVGERMLRDNVSLATIKGLPGSGKFVEVRGTAEKEPVDEEQLLALLALARKGVGKLVDMQKMAVM